MLMTDVVARRKIDPALLDIDFGLDPLGDMARTGRALLPWPELSARAGGTARDLAAKGFAKARFLRADGRAVHEAGGSEAQELAFALAAGVAYLRLLETSGFTLDEARRRISFMLAADADEFLTIAKFRALRKLWARVEQASGLTPQPAFVSAETAWRMMTARDPYVNMLRTTIAVTAAGVGGADSVTALPFTLALGLPDRFARRVARNMQLILLEESNLYRVADPAAGSGGIEALTTEMAQSGLETVPGDRSGRRRGGGARTRPAAKEGRRDARGAAGGDRQAQGRAHRHERLSQPGGSAGQGAGRAARERAGSCRPRSRRCRASASPNRSKRLRDKSDAILAKTGNAAASVPRQSRQAIRVHRARHLRPQFLRGRRHRGGHQRRFPRSCRAARRLQSVRRQARLPVLLR